MQSGEIPVFNHFQNLSRFGSIRHFITTRNGGISKHPFNGLNLGLHTRDNESHVIRNRLIMADTLNILPGSFIYARQAHTGNIAIVDKSDAGRGLDSFACSIPDTDAMITAIPGLCLVVLVADCVPVLIYDPVKHVAAVAHAGWRGTIKQISGLTVQKMCESFGSSPADLICGIGPSAGPCCYEVGIEVIEETNKLQVDTAGYLLKSEKPGKAVFDLWASNLKQLTLAGVKAENVEISGKCTLCNSEVYFSSRAENGVTGRFAAGIFLE